MDLRNPFIFRLSRLNLSQPSRHTAQFQLSHDGPQPIRRLRMPSTHVMAEIAWIVDKASVAHDKFRKASGVKGEAYRHYR